jgi:hypothetical protein
MHCKTIKPRLFFTIVYPKLLCAVSKKESHILCYPLRKNEPMFLKIWSTLQKNTSYCDFRCAYYNFFSQTTKYSCNRLQVYLNLHLKLINKATRAHEAVMKWCCMSMCYLLKKFENCTKS